MKIMHETYEYSKSKVRKVRLADALWAIPGLLVIAFIAGLGVGNTVAVQIADSMFDHWNPWAVAALLIAAFGVYFEASRKH